MKKRQRRITKSFVDRAVQLNQEIRQNEAELRDLRAKLKQVGRHDLTRKCLVAPTELFDLAGFLWRGEAMVLFGEQKAGSNTKAETLMVTQYPQQFMLCTMELIDDLFSEHKIESDFTASVADDIIQSRLGKWTVVTSNCSLELASNFGEAEWRDAQLNDLEAAARTKALSNVIQRTTARKTLADRRSLTRELAIELAWMWPLEEWACIFPDAALAGDTDFIQKITASHSNGAPALDYVDAIIALNWNSTQKTTVPPLKYWSDQTACEFVLFVTGEDLSILAYKKRKQRLGFHSEKPVLVTFAKCTQQNGKRLLSCRA